MRGTKAKMLRRSVYGDQSIRAARQYIGVSVLRVVTPRGEFTRVTRINAPKSLDTEGIQQTCQEVLATRMRRPCIANQWLYAGCKAVVRSHWDWNPRVSGQAEDS
jgi:hypothetical protein